jgi:uncharacterized protein YbaR (Trm112 family)
VHLLLTDRLTCPRCGPTFGLILLADRMEGRLVLEGVLGCSNCRDKFPIVGGFGDLRVPPRGEPGPGLVGPPVEEARGEADRLRALLGLAGGPGTVVLAGEPARHAPELGVQLGEMRIVAIDPDLRLWPETAGVSRLVAGPGLPFFSSTVRAVALDGRLDPSWLGEAARALVPRGRLVVTRAPEDTAGRLEELGLRVLAREAEMVVAATG